MYHCHVADLLADSQDFRAQDAAHRARETLGAVANSVSFSGTNDAVYETIVNEDGGDRAHSSVGLVSRIEETDVRDLAMMASMWVKRLGSSVNPSSLLFKLSFALTLAAANPRGETGGFDMPPPPFNGTLDLTGIWRSRYSYFSSRRGQEFDSIHYVMFRQSGQQVTAESLPHPTGSKFSLSLTVDGVILTGTWVEHTSPTGYYKGAIYR
ncbi:MAG: hypothetical protein M3319_14780, partial [Actinomycetota bacterium]|nr:hypothetical protein [Actinomycetota bacterium]